MSNTSTHKVDFAVVKRQFPLSFEALCEHDQITDDVGEPLRWLDFNDGLLCRYYDDDLDMYVYEDRDLYDFFDRHSLRIQIDSLTGNNTLIYDADRKEFYQHKMIKSRQVFNRKYVETIAFFAAFKLLEKRLERLYGTGEAATDTELLISDKVDDNG